LLENKKKPPLFNYTSCKRLFIAVTEMKLKDEMGVTCKYVSHPEDEKCIHNFSHETSREETTTKTYAQMAGY
jgi:hypothetical protein